MGSPMLPTAVVRALRLAAVHPAVADVRVIDQSARSAIAEIDIRTELCAAWRMAGQSPFGIKSTETVTLVFPADYPSAAPSVLLRSDFDRSHPHINPGAPDMPPQPCIVAGSPRELLQSRGFEGFLDQIVDWLDKAAMLALNNPSNGWEPVRRDTIDDYILIDGPAARALATAAGGSAIIGIGYWCLKIADERTFAVHHPLAPIVTPKAAVVRRGHVRDNLFQGVSLGIVLWPKLATPGGPFTVSTYLPETVVTLNDLFERATVYGCRQELDASLNHIVFELDRRKDGPHPITITFLVPRPYQVIGTGSSIELCSYLVEITAAKDIVAPGTRVRCCAIRERLSLPLLRRASGLDESLPRKPWVLIGCGSVGSKIAIHLARSGFGPSLLVDKARIAPHNYARHSLLPEIAEHPVLSPFKSPLLASDLNRFLQEPGHDSDDILCLLATDDGKKRLAPDTSSVLLNTTASTVVRETLSASKWHRRPRICEAHLLGAGRAAYAAFEGSDGNPNLSDLAAESYLHIAADHGLRSIVFSAQAEAISIGQGCGAVTFPMPDHTLSSLTAGLAHVFLQRLNTSTVDGGELLLASVAQDGLSQSWSRHVIAPFKTVVDSSGISVRVSSRVDDVIRKEIASRPGSETGGVIVGRFSQIGNCFHVVDLIPAPPDSTFSPEQFVLGTSGLKSSIKTLIRKSHGTLYPIGTWHNHLVKSGPSLLDAATAAKLSLRQFFPVLMLIALPEGYSCLTAEPATTNSELPLVHCSTSSGEPNVP